MGERLAGARGARSNMLPRLRAMMISVAALVACAAQGAGAQATPTVIEVRRGDTFSGIVERFFGDGLNWRRMYRLGDSRLLDPNLILVGTRLEVVTAGDGGKYLRAVDTGAAASTLAEGPVALPDALVVGVLPNIAAAKLMSQYENLKRYLERLNGKEVRIVLPANFRAFFESTMQGQYDLAISAPHLARVAQIDGKLIPLAMYEPRINALLVAPRNSKLKSARDVRGQAVAFANPQSLVAMYGQQWLKQLGLAPGKDYEIKAARTDMGVGRMMILGEAAAAIMSQGELMSLPYDELAQMQIVDLFARVPNFVVLAHPRLGAAARARLKTQLVGFLEDQPDGVAFKSATGLTGIVDPDETILRELDAYVGQTRAAMAAVK
jgi:phosphonate transport system substrate-binding protein